MTPGDGLVSTAPILLARDDWLVCPADPPPPSYGVATSARPDDLGARVFKLRRRVVEQTVVQRRFPDGLRRTPPFSQGGVCLSPTRHEAQASLATELASGPVEAAGGPKGRRRPQLPN